MLQLENNLCLPPIHEILSCKAYPHDAASDKVKLAPLRNHDHTEKMGVSASPPPQPIHPSSSSSSPPYTKDYNRLPFGMESLALSPPSPAVRNRAIQHRRSFSDTSLIYHHNDDPLRIIYRVSPPPGLKRSSSSSLSSQQQQQQQQQRRYTCHYCEKSFIRPSSLRTHTYSHTGQKPFECAFEGCDKRFSVLSNMRRHMRRHRPFSSSSSSSPPNHEQ